MTTIGNLWAIGYDDIGRAAQVRDRITRLGDKHCLILLDTAVAVRYPDGTLTLDGERFAGSTDLSANTSAGFLAGLALAVPLLTEGAVGALCSWTGAAASDRVGIDEDFVCRVQRLMKPGTSALFVLDQQPDMAAILQGIKGLGGTVLKTNVDLERAKLIQSTLAAAATDRR